MPIELAAIAHRIRAAVGADPDIELLVVFGSMSQGGTHPDSDLDIALLPRLGTDMTLMEELRLQHVLSVAADLEVDLVRLDKTTPVVRHEVARNGTPLLERSPGAFGRFAADAMLEYLDILPLLEQGRRRYLARIAAGHP